MNCEEFGQRMHQCLDQRLPIDADDQLSLHALQCESCRAQMHAWCQIATIMPRSGVDLPVTGERETQSRGSHGSQRAVAAVALAAVMLVSIWASVGFQMVILLAALQDVPETLYEAARLDGAGRWQQFRNVTLPGIRNPLLFVLTVTTILSFRLFDQVWIMPARPGGPLDSTRTLMVDIVDTGLNNGAVGRGSALSVIFLLIVLTVAIVQRRLIKQEGEVR